MFDGRQYFFNWAKFNKNTTETEVTILQSVPQNQL